MDISIKRRVIESLKRMDVYKEYSGGTQHLVKCPYCERHSQKDHGHFSIKIDPDDESLMIYNCFKCPASGIVTLDVLDDLNAPYDNTIADDLKSFNKKAVKHNKRFATKEPKLFIPNSNQSKLSDMKLSYINKRLGLNLGYEDVIKHKIILDIYEFLKINELTELPGISYKYLYFINMNYVGFLSKNNNCITFRNFTGVDSKRYVKVKINPNLMNNNSFYTIPSSIDLLYTQDIDIHIAEGTFDILSIYHNVHECNDVNNFYFAACGFGYISILKYLIRVGLNTGITVHIYSDRDKSDNDHMEYLSNRKISPWIDHIVFHRNQYEGEKDYGVPKERIIDGKYRVK